MLVIENLSAHVDGIPILKNFSLTLTPGKIVAIMGPNGAGKSTLAKVLAGHPSYEITSGTATLDGIDLLDKDPEERAHMGFFMSFQYPLEISGVSNVDFLKAAYNAKNKALGKKEVDTVSFSALLDETLAKLEMRSIFKERNINEGFSGGEKKRNEILQMAILKPSCAILDETDSGLDIDALRVVADGVKKLMDTKTSLLLITHYQRLLTYISVDTVHVMIDGAIVHSGGAELALELEERGYDWLKPLV